MAKRNSVTIAVMGATGAGKSTFINAASKSKLVVGHGLESCTSEVEAAPPFMLGTTSVTLIDTPGFDDTVKTETEILRLICDFLSITYMEKHTLHGVIFLQRVADTRIGGIARRNLRLFQKICGDDALKNVVIATTMWTKVDHALAEAREREMAESPLFFKHALSKGARMVRHGNTAESALQVIREIIGFSPIPLQIQREMVDEQKALADTLAGQDLKADLERQAAEHKAELEDLNRNIRKHIAENQKQNEEKISELKADLEEIQDKLAKVEVEACSLRAESETSRLEHENKIRHMADSMSAKEEKLQTLQKTVRMLEGTHTAHLERLATATGMQKQFRALGAHRSSASSGWNSFCKAPAGHVAPTTKNMHTPKCMSANNEELRARERSRHYPHPLRQHYN
ncbi:P-loop containing nucleoside triphosphate hydrolase protein [Phanerochaete sordida]|uniref:P-loop containing nucleoside triphosphate hydrolase protein n=1 Tax=Phanerochaete sordida TaxID=48140 RepID=A0A9P3G8N4_9APHY|nr:P-loop containing nucleoside triphosphate hydrolase protein [Phanerochaete sordida]